MDETTFDFVDLNEEDNRIDELADTEVDALNEDEIIDAEENTSETAEAEEPDFVFVDLNDEDASDLIDENTEEVEETEDIAEETDAADEEEMIEADPMDLINEDRHVSVSFQWESDDHVFGQKILARATLTGYENTVYKLQWQHSKDGVNYTDVSGATGETLEFVVTEDNYMDYWQVKVVIVAVKSEN